MNIRHPQVQIATLGSATQYPPKKLPSPSEFLKQAVGRKVVVKLHNNNEYKGILICLDGTMNVYLQQCEEYVNGQIANRFAEIFIRGNNGKK